MASFAFISFSVYVFIFQWNRAWLLYEMIHRVYITADVQSRIEEKRGSIETSTSGGEARGLRAHSARFERLFSMHFPNVPAIRLWLTYMKEAWMMYYNFKISNWNMMKWRDVMLVNYYRFSAIFARFDQENIRYIVFAKND